MKEGGKDVKGQGGMGRGGGEDRERGGRARPWIFVQGCHEFLVTPQATNRQHTDRATILCAVRCFSAPLVQ